MLLKPETTTMLTYTKRASSLVSQSADNEITLDQNKFIEWWTDEFYSESNIKFEVEWVLTGWALYF